MSNKKSNPLRRADGTHVLNTKEPYETSRIERRSTEEVVHNGLKIMIVTIVTTSKRVVTSLPCKVCGEQFYPFMKTQKTCNKRCSNVVTQRQYRAKHKKETDK